MATAKYVYLSFMVLLCLGLCSSHKVIKGIINLPKMTAEIAALPHDHDDMQLQSPELSGELSIKTTHDCADRGKGPGCGSGGASGSGSGSWYGSGNGGGSASGCHDEPDPDVCRTGHPPEIIIPLPQFPFPDISIPQIPLPRIVSGCPIFGCESQSEKISSETLGPRSSIEMDHETRQEIESNGASGNDAMRPVGNPRAAPGMMSSMEMKPEREHAIVGNPRAAPRMMSSMEMEHEREHAIVGNPRAAHSMTSSMEMKHEREHAIVDNPRAGPAMSFNGKHAIVGNPRAAPTMSSIGGVDVPGNPMAEPEHKTRDAPRVEPQARGAISPSGPRSAIVHLDPPMSPAEMAHGKRRGANSVGEVEPLVPTSKEKVLY